jgi:ubiquinone/menaquinone biosynthesis C-methylase UbiE
MDKKTGLAEGYIHGFTGQEQDRLYRQARVNEELIFSKVDFRGCREILEVGSGVGAQTQILLERFPYVKIQCIDASPQQTARAKATLAEAVTSGRVKIDTGDALHLPYADQTFDGAFICWLLEHVREPVEILRETRRAMRAGGAIYCNEVLNATFYLSPYSPATQRFWTEFNDHQWTLKGDPFVGGKLANYMMEAGFRHIETFVRTHHYDNRTPEVRAKFIDYWTDLLLSASESLLATGRVDTALVSEMKKELGALRTDPNAVIFYSWILARGEA